MLWSNETCSLAMFFCDIKNRQETGFGGAYPILAGILNQDFITDRTDS